VQGHLGGTFRADQVARHRARRLSRVARPSTSASMSAAARAPAGTVPVVEGRPGSRSAQISAHRWWWVAVVAARVPAAEAVAPTSPWPAAGRDAAIRGPAEAAEETTPTASGAAVPGGAAALRHPAPGQHLQAPGPEAAAAAHVAALMGAAVPATTVVVVAPAIPLVAAEATIAIRR
jgi:hypothetical protein